jgi:uncharacterized membrane protein YeaQ/YmgE (transglycosylase-associated protein family)
MNLFIWLAVGGIIGWLASVVMKTNAKQGVLLNLAVGVLGAFLGGWLLAPIFHIGTINQNDFGMLSLLISFAGAVLLLAAVNFYQAGRVR